LATEAVSALVRHAAAHPDIQQLVADTDPGNTRSQRVLAACGLADRGLRDRRQSSRRGSKQVRSYELVPEEP
jgi:RimJ/RimL family protein N-acetyltransferase